MKPWYTIVTLREEVREGRSFSPDEFAIALDQVVKGNAPNDYSDPKQFFSRTCFTRELKKHVGMVLRRLSGETQQTAPVLTLITQFGGGKTHTLTALYHLAKSGADASKFPGVSALLTEKKVVAIPSTRVGVFVGNAWDPKEGREMPWIDLAHQIAGDKGVDALGATAHTTPPGTEALARMFAAAGAPVLLLFDEVLNFVNRHRDLAEGFYAFIQNLTVAVTGSKRTVAVISLPRSQVEMTDWDQQWQERITKVVRRVALDLITNDESEISEIVRRRLFENIGDVHIHKKISKIYTDWCFERTERLPSEWLAVDTALESSKAKEFLRSRFEACYPFHPATLSVFQRKWRALPQFQQTRGALAMLAQWVSLAATEQFYKARKEPLITLGSAPLDVPEFRAVVLGQLGESRLDAAIDADLASSTSHARVLDMNTDGNLRDIHRRVGTAILFESSGGQVEKVAHLPELRFALGEPDVETTSIDSAAMAMDESGFFIRKVGTDGYCIHHQATLRKVVSDRRASLNEETEIKPTLHRIVEKEFKPDSTISVIFFPEDSSSIQDYPRLTMIVLDPEDEWIDGNKLIEKIAHWTKERGGLPRLYPGSLIWCARKPGNELRNKIEMLLAWKRVAHEMADGTLGPEYDRIDRSKVQNDIRDAEQATKDEVWASYRFIALADTHGKHGLKIIDLGAGHASASETFCRRIINALKMESLLNDSVSAGYIERNWPPTLKDSGTWTLLSLRQSFLNGVLTRLLDPDKILRRQIVDFVAKGEFGMASGVKSNDDFERFWYTELINPDEVAFEKDVFLLTKSRAEQLKESKSLPHRQPDARELDPDLEPELEKDPALGSESNSSIQKANIQVIGNIPAEVWNLLGTRLLSKLRSRDDLKIRIEFSASINSQSAKGMEKELRQILDDLDLNEVHIEISESISEKNE